MEPEASASRTSSRSVSTTCAARGEARKRARRDMRMRGRVARIWRQERGGMRAEAARTAALHDARGFDPPYVAWRPTRKTAPILRVTMSMDVLGERLEMQGRCDQVRS